MVLIQTGLGILHLLHTGQQMLNAFEPRDAQSMKIDNYKESNLINIIDNSSPGENL